MKCDILSQRQNKLPNYHTCNKRVPQFTHGLVLLNVFHLCLIATLNLFTVCDQLNSIQDTGAEPAVRTLRSLSIRAIDASRVFFMFGLCYWIQATMGPLLCFFFFLSLCFNACFGLCCIDLHKLRIRGQYTKFKLYKYKIKVALVTWLFLFFISGRRHLRK